MVMDMAMVAMAMVAMVMEAMVMEAMVMVMEKKRKSLFLTCLKGLRR